MEIVNVLKGLTPPILWNSLKRLQTYSIGADVRAGREFGVERLAEFYDEKMEQGEALEAALHRFALLPGLDCCRRSPEARDAPSYRCRTGPYDAVVLLEVLEHLNRDLEVLEMLRPDTYLIGTVPNFPAAGRVRHFESAEHVSARYSSCFSKMRVDSLTANPGGATYFLIEGRR